MKQPLPLLSLAALLVPGLEAGNWPQFRGPTGQGISSEIDLPMQWDVEEGWRWRAEIPGESWSSPIVWGDHVFLTTATQDGTSCHVIALDRTSGTMLWDRMVFPQVPRRKERRNSYATPTPCTDGTAVFACFGDGSFAALDFDGTVLWINRDFPFYGQHGLGTSPILYGNLLIMARDGSSDGEEKKLGWQIPWDESYLLALDRNTGAVRWKGDRGPSRISHMMPLVWRGPDGRDQLISNAGDVVQAFDPDTGERIWTSVNIGEGVVPSPVIHGDLIYTASGWGGRESTKAFRLGGRGALGESNLVWEERKGMPRVPSFVFANDHLFWVNDGGVAMCLDGRNGEIQWQERIGGNHSASPVAAGGRIYFLADDASTTVIEAGPDFKVLARNPLEGNVQASPAISQGNLFIRTEHRLYRVGE